MTPDLSTLRARQAEAVDAIDRRSFARPVAGSPAFVGLVFGNPTVPTAAERYYSVHPVTVRGTVAEGGVGSITVVPTVTVLVYVVGPRAAQAGERLICRFVGNRWAADVGGTHKDRIILTGCPCATLPTTLFMSVNNSALNKNILQSCTFVYDTTPPELLSLSLGATSYLSVESFVEQNSTDTFRYYFTCYTGFYVVSRVYIKCIFGAPFRDIFRYSWLMGLRGNTCVPFALTFGQIFPGGDPSCVVTITENPPGP